METAKADARKYYEEASAIDLNPCSAIKLGLALNLSVFYYEVMKDRVNACKYADIDCDFDCCPKCYNTKINSEESKETKAKSIGVVPEDPVLTVFVNRVNSQYEFAKS